jgi:hypothetical protein
MLWKNFQLSVDSYHTYASLGVTKMNLVPQPLPKEVKGSKAVCRVSEVM